MMTLGACRRSAGCQVLSCFADRSHECRVEMTRSLQLVRMVPSSLNNNDPGGGLITSQLVK
jgi:hypothetical protein